MQRQIQVRILIAYGTDHSANRTRGGPGHRIGERKGFDLDAVLLTNIMERFNQLKHALSRNIAFKITTEGRHDAGAIHLNVVVFKHTNHRMHGFNVLSQGALLIA